MITIPDGGWPYGGINPGGGILKAGRGGNPEGIGGGPNPGGGSLGGIPGPGGGIRKLIVGSDGRGGSPL